MSEAESKHQIYTSISMPIHDSYDWSIRFATVLLDYRDHRWYVGVTRETLWNMIGVSSRVGMPWAHDTIKNHVSDQANVEGPNGVVWILRSDVEAFVSQLGGADVDWSSVGKWGMATMAVLRSAVKVPGRRGDRPAFKQTT